MDKYTISKENLEKLLKEQSKTLVGICMRRFEIFDNNYKTRTREEKEYRKNLKKAVKEIIYENFRTLKSLIVTFSSGVEFKEQEPKEQD